MAKTAIWLFGVIKSLIAGRSTGRITIDLFEGGIGKVYFKKELKPE
jgi:hypothetical protein